MSDPFVGEIRMFAGYYAPNGWAFCDGRLMSKAENETLFAVIGTLYGGDGTSTFGLPDLRGRVPIHRGNGYTQGEMAGAEEVTLTVQQVLAHSHAFIGTTSSADTPGPAGSVVAAPTTIDLYRPAATPAAAMTPGALSTAGGSQPHNNLQPFLCVNFIISLFGITPTPS